MGGFVIYTTKVSWVFELKTTRLDPIGFKSQCHRELAKLSMAKKTNTSWVLCLAKWGAWLSVLPYYYKHAFGPQEASRTCIRTYCF